MKGVSNHAFKAYEFSHFIPTSYLSTLLTHANNTRKLWHEIFGHQNFKYLQYLHNDKMVEGLSLIKSSEGVCTGFLVGKHLEKIYEVGKEIRVSSTLYLIHSDVSRPIPIKYLNGSRYFLTFIDDCSRYCWIYFPRQKSKVFETFKIFKAFAENHLRTLFGRR